MHPISPVTARKRASLEAVFFRCVQIHKKFIFIMGPLFVKSLFIDQIILKISDGVVDFPDDIINVGRVLDHCINRHQIRIAVNTHAHFNKLDPLFIDDQFFINFTGGSKSHIRK